ncbi:hypothetical protein JOC86_003975 [Bacillus pakistanensis]|uniref:Uncharacterized protein n=1 Tax=Rossellomorea pakistanensis TaxID=992288 RepID=A0ABS2NHQ5_9BACI|nr:hypothetical protein [Bacillus pakistanensis]
MDENWTSKASITPIVEYAYVRIDIDNNIAEVNRVDYKQNTVMRFYFDIDKNVIMKTGTLELYKMRIQLTQ